MNQKISFPLLAILVLTTSAGVQAQQAAKTSRLGYLGGSLAANVARTDALRQGLRELGYTEGKTFL